MSGGGGGTNQITFHDSEKCMSIFWNSTLLELYLSLNDRYSYYMYLLFINIQLDSVVPSDGDAFMQKEVQDLKDTVRVSKMAICFS